MIDANNQSKSGQLKHQAQSVLINQQQTNVC